MAPIHILTLSSKKEKGEVESTEDSLKRTAQSQAPECISVIPAPGRLKQEDLKFKASLGHIVTPVSKSLSPHTQKSTAQMMNTFHWSEISFYGYLSER
jgi:hypothetical protein